MKRRPLAAVLLLVVLVVLVALRTRRPAAPARADPLEGRAAAGSRPAAATLFGARLDLNLASAEDLVELPGIGPARARDILRARADRGGFSSLEDLLDVPGIGPATLEKLRAQVMVGDELPERGPAPHP